MADRAVAEQGAGERGEVRAFVRTAARFAIVGLVLYAALYVFAETLVYRYAQRNRFFAVRSAPARFGVVVLGASHAAVFDYRDMNSRLEQLTGATIMNLAVVGGGVVINRLLFDYFLTRHQADAVLYVVDSFAFYSPEWNERRLQDRRLFMRAPFDPALAGLLLGRTEARSVAADYISGFSKINNQDRFAADLFPDEGPRFDRRYRPVPQLDEERIAYLYPNGPNAPSLERYMGEFERPIAAARERGITVLAMKPPIPERMRRRLPSEAEFDASLRAALGRHGFELHDLSNVANDEALFYDSDHLNQAGVLELYKTALAPLLASSTRR